MFRAMLRLVKHSAIYGTGYVLSRALMFFLLPIHTNFMTKAQYGVVTELYAFMAVGAIIYSLGLNNAEIQFYITDSDREKRKRLVSTAFYITFIWTLFLSLIIFFGRTFLSGLFFHSKEYGSLVSITALIMVFDVVSLLGYNIYRAEQKSQFFILIHFLQVAVIVVFTFLFVVKYRMGPRGVFLANLIGSGTAFLFLLPVLSGFFIKTIDLKLLKRMLSFGLPFIPAIIGLVLINVVDRFFITRMLGLEAAGIYGAGYKLGMTINLIVIGFSYAWHPFYLSVSKEPESKELFSTVLTYFLLLCAIVFLVISFYLNDIVRFKISGITFFGRNFWDSTVIVPIVMLSYIMYGCVMIFQAGIYINEKTRYLVLISGIGAAANIIGNIILIRIFGITGAAIATFFSFAIMAVLSYIISDKFLKIKYDFIRILHLIMAAAAVYFSYKYFKIDFGRLTGIVFVLLFLLVLIVTGFFSVKEREKVRHILARLWH